jgi:hypothetical protein
MAEAGEVAEGHEHRIEILVNDGPVTVKGREQTGLRIKEAAIHQNVPIKRDFALSVERGGKLEHVGDDERIRVHSHEKFVAAAREHRIELFVNDKPVIVEGHKQTGLSVKEAAIAQKVQIQLDFILSIERGGGKTELVGDDQTIDVHKHERFLAIPHDDNS